MNAHFYISLVMQFLTTPRQAARSVMAAQSVTSTSAWACLVVGYALSAFSTYALYLIPGYTQYMEGAEMLAGDPFSLQVLVGNAIFALVVFAVIYKVLTYFGTSVSVTKYALLTGLMYITFALVAVLQAPFIWMGSYVMAIVVATIASFYLVILWVKAESEMFALGFWKVFFLNLVVMGVASIGYAMLMI